MVKETRTLDNNHSAVVTWQEPFLSRNQKIDIVEKVVKVADSIRFDPILISGNRTEKSLRTDNKRLIVFKNLNINNRQSLIWRTRKTRSSVSKLSKYKCFVSRLYTPNESIVFTPIQVVRSQVYCYMDITSLMTATSAVFLSPVTWTMVITSRKRGDSLTTPTRIVKTKTKLIYVVTKHVTSFA